MNESKRLLKPMIENAIDAGLLKRPNAKVHDVDFSLLLDVADARLAVEDITTAEDFVEMVLMWLDIDASDVVALRAYLIGFKGGLKASETAGSRQEDYADGLPCDEGVGLYCTCVRDGGASMNPEEKAAYDLKVMTEAVTKEETPEAETATAADSETAEPVGK